MLPNFFERSRKMKSFVINKNDAGQRLDKFITKAAPMLPKTLLYKYVRIKRIKINGKKGDIATKLQVGDLVEMYINDEFFVQKAPKYDFLSAPATLNIVYEDENILIADKKQGLLSHPDKNEYGDTLIARIQHYLYDKGEFLPDEESSFKPALCNRIDRNTGGMVIAAKNAAALREMCDRIKEREVIKKYLTVVHGVPKKRSDELTAYLEKDEEKNRVFLHARPDADTKTAKLRYRTVATTGDLSLLEVELLTGRTHQIRAQLAGIGCPLLGDGKYGKTGGKDKAAGFSRQALYSYYLKFDFSDEEGILSYLNKKEFKVGSVWFAEELFGEKGRVNNI